MRVNYAIVFVSDMDRSVAFYRDIFGLPLRFASPGWSEFETEGATLALHASENLDSPGPDPLPTPPGRCRTGFCVPDLDEFHRRMLESKVPCLEEPREVYGTRIALYSDPDGLAIGVSQERAAG